MANRNSFFDHFFDRPRRSPSPPPHTSANSRLYVANRGPNVTVTLGMDVCTIPREALTRTFPRAHRWFRPGPSGSGEILPLDDLVSPLAALDFPLFQGLCGFAASLATFYHRFHDDDAPDSHLLAEPSTPILDLQRTAHDEMNFFQDPDARDDANATWAGCVSLLLLLFEDLGCCRALRDDMRVLVDCVVRGLDRNQRELAARLLVESVQVWDAGRRSRCYLLGELWTDLRQRTQNEVVELANRLPRGEGVRRRGLAMVHLAQHSALP